MILIARNISKFYPSKCKFMFTDHKDNNKQDNKERQTSISPTKQQDLMEDNYQKTELPGSQGRNITNTTTFQQQILQTNKFDIMNPQIYPKMASVKGSMGIQLKEGQYLAEIDLGKVKIKAENQVFLSEVDPRQIPEHYDIIFDYQKEMSVMGKKMTQQEGQSTMKIEANKSFEEKSIKEMNYEVFGFNFFKWKTGKYWVKEMIISALVALILWQPYLDIIINYWDCIQSIGDIEVEREKIVAAHKKAAVVEALLSHPDLKIV